MGFLETFPRELPFLVSWDFLVVLYRVAVNDLLAAEGMTHGKEAEVCPQPTYVLWM